MVRVRILRMASRKRENVSSCLYTVLHENKAKKLILRSFYEIKTPQPYLLPLKWINFSYTGTVKHYKTLVFRAVTPFAISFHYRRSSEY
jgi:hypothetical protein